MLTRSSYLALLCRYYSEHEAARAFDRAALCIYGDLAVTNFGLAAARQDPTPVSAHIIRVSQEYERFRNEQEVAQNTMQQQQQQLNAAIQQAVALQQQQQLGTSAQTSIQQLLLQHQQQQKMLSLESLVAAQASQPSLTAPPMRGFSLPLPQLHQHQQQQQQQQLFALQQHGYHGFSDPLPQLQLMPAAQPAHPASDSPTASYSSSNGLTATDLLMSSQSFTSACSKGSSAMVPEDAVLALGNSSKITTAELLSLTSQGLAAACPDVAATTEGNATEWLLRQLAALNLKAGSEATAGSEGSSVPEPQSSSSFSVSSSSGLGMPVLRFHSSPRIDQLQAGTSGSDAAAGCSAVLPPPPPPRGRPASQQLEEATAAAATAAADAAGSGLMILMPEGGSSSTSNQVLGNQGLGLERQGSGLVLGNAGAAAGTVGINPHMFEALRHEAHLDAMIMEQQQQLEQLQQLRLKKQQERVMLMQQGMHGGAQ